MIYSTSGEVVVQARSLVIHDLGNNIAGTEEPNTSRRCVAVVKKEAKAAAEEEQLLVTVLWSVKTYIPP